MTSPTFRQDHDEVGVNLFQKPQTTTVNKNNKSAHQSCDLPVTAPVDGTPASNSLKFRKHIGTFEGGTPQEFVDVSNAIREIWKRSNLTATEERLNVISNLILGDDLDALVTAVESERAFEGAETELVDWMLQHFTFFRTVPWQGRSAACSMP